MGLLIVKVIDLLTEALISLGRPRINIPYEQLNFLVERRFTVRQIAAVREVLRTHPYTGQKRMMGYLASQGHRVQQTRALELNVINCRSYSVSSPLALWHIDGNHKLIR